MKKIKFNHQKGWGEHNCYSEIFEYEDNVSDEDIQKDYEDWVWQQIGDDFWWSEDEE